MFKENRESLINHLDGFYRHVQYQKEHGNFESIHKSACGYVDNQISAEEGMSQYYAYLEECERSDRRLFRAIASVKGKTFVKRLKELINGEQTYGTRCVILREPVGEYQKETEYGNQIKGIWLQQWSTGTEGDSFSGIICVEIRPGRYFKFDFSM